jgi:predicted transposase/invertase (TIGR01784 family)
MTFDNTCKYLSENNPTEFATWLLGETPPSIQVVKTELGIDPIRADFLAALSAEKRLLHLEFQVKDDEDIPLPLRMLDYWVRIHRIYRQPVTQFLIMLRYSKAAAEIPKEFKLEGTRHRYNIIRMWEQDPTPLLANPALLPLAVLCEAEDKMQLLDRVAGEVSKIPQNQQREVISNCTQILAGLRFKKDLIREIFTGGIMRESVIYQEILEEGIQRGLQQGQLEGKQQEALAFIMRQLRRRVGIIETQVQEKIQKLSVSKLEDLGEDLLDFSTVADVINWLDNNQ